MRTLHIARNTSLVTAFVVLALMLQACGGETVTPDEVIVRVVVAH